MLSRALFLLALGSQFLRLAIAAQTAAALVPAYIYPQKVTTWQPLYNQIAAFPNITFRVIINPSSGPGANALPGADYEREIKKLRTYKNTQLVGYVPVNYTNQAISQVKADVAKYANWKAASNNAVYLDGIFFDEAPADNNATKIAYMQTAIQSARTTSNTNKGLGASPYVVTNPGIPPTNRSYLVMPGKPVPDLALVYEEWYTTWTTNTEAKRQAIWAEDVADERLAVMLHNVPKTLSCTQIDSVVQDLKGNVGVGTLWFTEDGDYQVWPQATLWKSFLKAFVNRGSACT